MKLVYSGQNVDTICEEIENAIKGAANKIIPKKEKKNGNSNRTKMWYNKECEEAIKIYHKAEKQFLKNHTVENLITMKKEQAKKKTL